MTTIVIGGKAMKITAAHDAVVSWMNWKSNVWVEIITEAGTRNCYINFVLVERAYAC